MQIRAMREADLADVETLAVQLGYPNAREDLQRRFREIDGEDDYALLVAQLDGGAVIGYIQVNVEPKTLLIDAPAGISALVVHESHRSRGVGSALVAGAEAWARRKGLHLIRVRTNSTRHDAHRFYLREGYTVSKTSCIFTRALG
jgi:GNAT superfamily N-acetyltransferase